MHEALGGPSMGNTNALRHSLRSGAVVARGIEVTR
jgi:hypothetical protein